MERLALEIGVIIVVYLMGYRFGFKACFDYLNCEKGAQSPSSTK